MTLQEKLLKKFAHQFHALKATFENCTKDRMRHFNMSVAVNAAEIKIQEFQ